jgi:hypothetical protein
MSNRRDRVDLSRTEIRRIAHRMRPLVQLYPSVRKAAVALSISETLISLVLHEPSALTLPEAALVDFARAAGVTRAELVEAIGPATSSHAAGAIQ